MVDEFKVAPHSDEAEIAVLGSILKDYDYCMEFIDDIKQEYFYKESNGIIFSAMKDLHISGIPIDEVTLKDELKNKEKLEKAGGAYYLTGLIEATPSGGMIQYYIGIIKEHYEQRYIKILSYELNTKAQNKENPEEIKEYAFEKLLDISDNKKIDELITNDKILERRKEGLVHRISNVLIGTGIPIIDQYLSNGYEAGHTSIICGRPGNGKSALKENISILQCKEGIETLHLTPEQGFDTEMDRMTSILTGLPLFEIIRIKNWATINNGRIQTEYKEKLEKIKEAANEIASWKINFYGGKINMQIMRRLIIETKRKFGLKVVWVDLFNRLEEVSTATQNKHQVINKCLDYEERLAREYGVHICNIVQLNREVEKRADKRPMLSDLKESGAFEENAWLIFGVYRDALFNKATIIDDEIEVSILKQKNGSTETLKLLWEKETLLISEKEGAF